MGARGGRRDEQEAKTEEGDDGDTEGGAAALRGATANRSGGSVGGQPAGRGAGVRGVARGGAEVPAAVPAWRGGGAAAEAEWGGGQLGGQGQAAQASRCPAPGGGDDPAGAPGVGHAADPGCAGAVRRAGRVGDGGPTDPARGGADTGDSSDERAEAGAAAAVRAGRTEPAVAVRHLHVSVAPSRAGVRGRVHGRPLALPGLLRTGAPPEIGAGAGGAGAGDCRVRGAAGAFDRQRPAVHGLAGRDLVRAAPAPAGHPPHQEPPTAPADAGQGGALLEDAVGRAPVADGVCRLRRPGAAVCAVGEALQLPAAAPGAGRAGPGRPILPGGAGDARGHRAERRGQCGAPGPGAAAAQTLLPGRPAGRPGPADRRPGRTTARARGR